MFGFRAMVVICLLLICPEAALSLSAPLSVDYQLDLSVETAPETGTWPEMAAAVDGGFLAVSSEGYRLTVRPAPGGPLIVGLSRDDGRSFVTSRFEARVRLPLRGIVAAWDTQVPPFGTMFRRAPELEFEIQTRPQVGIPLVVLVDAHGNNIMAAGFVEQSKLCRIQGERAGCDYVLRMTRLAGDAEQPAAAWQSTLYIEGSPDYWFAALRRYADTVDSLTGYRPKPIPEGAYEPVYSTNYAFQDDINEEIVWNNAVEASKLGMGQILIDIGWSSEFGWADSNNDYGAYEPAALKFPDFRALVKRIQAELGMRVVLWISPTWIGSRSKHFEQMKDYRVKWPDGDYDRNLCPRTAEARAYLSERLSALARDYGIDGFWVDALDTCHMVCDAPHAHDVADYGEALGMMLDEIFSAVAAANPKATVEYRIPFSNLFVKRYANVFETTDAPDDYHANRLMGTFLRAYSNGIVVKGDPAYWQKDAHHEEVARHLMTSIMLGVPAVSVDLVGLSEERRNQVKGWLDFYHANRGDLLGGEFSPFGASFHFPDLKIVSDDKAFVLLVTRKSKLIQIERPVTTLCIMNSNPPEHGQLRLTVEGLPNGRYSGRYYDCWMRSDREEMFESADGVMPLSTDMPTGGLLVLTKL